MNRIHIDWIPPYMGSGVCFPAIIADVPDDKE